MKTWSSRIGLMVLGAIIGFQSMWIFGGGIARAEQPTDGDRITGEAAAKFYDDVSSELLARRANRKDARGNPIYCTSLVWIAEHQAFARAWTDGSIDALVVPRDTWPMMSGDETATHLWYPLDLILDPNNIERFDAEQAKTRRKR